MPDLVLSINYTNNQLQYIGQTENYSDTEWLTALEESVKIKNNDQKADSLIEKEFALLIFSIDI
jgi:hypothetical protein